MIRINVFQQADGVDLYHGMSFPMHNVIACIGSQSPGTGVDDGERGAGGIEGPSTNRRRLPGGRG